MGEDSFIDLIFKIIFQYKCLDKTNRDDELLLFVCYPSVSSAGDKNDNVSITGP